MNTSAFFPMTAQFPTTSLTAAEAVFAQDGTRLLHGYRTIEANLSASSEHSYAKKGGGFGAAEQVRGTRLLTRSTIGERTVIWPPGSDTSNETLAQPLVEIRRQLGVTAARIADS